MRRRGIWLLSIVLAAGLALAVGAESHEEAAPKPTFLYVWTEHVPLANAPEYEAEVKKVMAQIAETEEGKKLHYFALSGSGAYSYVIPMEELGQFAQKNQEFMAAVEAIGGMKVWDAAMRLVDHGSGQLLVSRPDLSYRPAEPREVEATGQLRVHEWWYIRPGHEMAIEEVARKVAALYAEKEIDTGFRIYQAVTGDDLPLYLVTFTAADAADHYANEARVNELLGEAGEKLLEEARASARRVETTMATMRPDLSMGI